MEYVDDLRELTGLSLEQLLADDDMYPVPAAYVLRPALSRRSLSANLLIRRGGDTHFSGDASMQEIIDFNLDVTDLYKNEDVQLANVDWDQVDWAHVAANWHEGEVD